MIRLNFRNYLLTNIKFFNQIVHVENRIIDVLKKKNIISENKYEDLYPVGSRPGILYDRAKIHKPNKNIVPSFRPILSATGKPIYKLSKLFVPLLTL